MRHVVGEQPLSMWSLADTDVRNAVEAAIDVEQGLRTDFLNEFPISYFSADEQGHFVHANATFAEWLGTTLENLIGGGKRPQEYLVEGSQGAAESAPHAGGHWLRQGRFCRVGRSDSSMLLRHRPW